MLRNIPPIIEADLHNMEVLECKTTNANILALLLHHYFDLRLERFEGTPGETPAQALAQTIEWAAKVHLLTEPSRAA